MFLVNSRLTHFTATPSFLLPAEKKSEFRISKHSCLFRASTFVLRVSSFLPAAKRRGHPFFRSYGARLPSSLTRFHSRALAQLCPPTCVGFRYGQPWEHLAAFLDTSFNRSGSAEASPSLPLRADRHFQSTACLHSCVTTKLNHSRCRNIEPAFHRLRPSAST